MLVPAGTPHFPALLSAAAILALLAPLAADASTREERLQVIKAGRRSYDPALPKLPPAAPVLTPEQRRAEMWRKSDEADAKAAAELAARDALRAARGEIYDLPTVVVRGETKPIKRLPRTGPVGSPRKDLKAEPFESGAGRDARLVQRHLSKVEQVLIPLLGGSAVGVAQGLESRQQKAAQMDDLASALELQEAAGLDPKEIKKLRAEYLKLHYSAPKQ